MDQRYRKTFDQITLPEDKAQAMGRRLAARCSDATKQEVIPMKKTRSFRRSRLIAVAVAAVLLLSLGTAGATGALKSVQEAFGGLFGSSPIQRAIVGEMGKAVGASATAGGLTITVDAILGDQSNYAIVFSITPQEGITLPTPGWRDGTQDENDTFLTYAFYEDGYPSSGRYTFYDADPSDPSIQFIEWETYPGGIPTRTIKKTFDSLVFGDVWSGEEEQIAAGPWKLTFPLDYEDNSLVLATDQAISVKGETATVDSIVISPLSLTIQSSFQEVIDWEEDMMSDPFASYEDAPLGRALMAIPVTLTLKDGTTVDAVRGDSGNIQDKGGKTCYTRSIQFIEVIPLDTMESVTIGETVFPIAP